MKITNFVCLLGMVLLCGCTGVDAVLFDTLAIKDKSKTVGSTKDGTEQVTKSPTGDMSMTEVSNEFTTADWVMQEYGRKFEDRFQFSLFTQKGYRPEKGCVYEHNGRNLRVFQIVGEFEVHSRKVWRLLVCADKGFDSLMVSVLTGQEYVTDEFLTAGFYCYSGTFSYRTKGDDNITVREFVDLSQGPVPNSTRARKVTAGRN